MKVVNKIAEDLRASFPGACYNIHVDSGAASPGGHSGGRQRSDLEVGNYDYSKCNGRHLSDSGC